MISTQIARAIGGFDEIISADDPDFGSSGLKTESVVRISRLAIVERRALSGAIGRIHSERLTRIRKILSDWITEK